MSAAELREFLAELMEKKLEEDLGDSDAGLSVRASVGEQLLRQMESVRQGRHGIPLSELED